MKALLGVCKVKNILSEKSKKSNSIKYILPNKSKFWPGESKKSKFKGQLQHFDKLSVFDRFRHVENGFDNNF